MATASKSTSKKTSTSRAATAKSSKSSVVKKPVAKKSVSAKTPAKKTTSKKVHSKSSASSSKNAPMRSFHLEKERHDFKSMRITRQTFYWLIIVCCLIFAQLWIIQLQVEVSALIDAQQMQMRNF